MHAGDRVASNATDGRGRVKAGHGTDPAVEPGLRRMAAIASSSAPR
jgi:hypothetical protein